MPDFTARITEILVEHRPEREGHSVGGGPRYYRCACAPPTASYTMTVLEHAAHVAELVAAVAEAHCRPRIETPEQLDALPAQSVIQSDPDVTGDGNPWTWERFDEGWFTTAFGPAGNPDLPATVLWSPGGER